MDACATLANAGITLRVQPDGRLRAEPRSALTDELRELLREHRAELVVVLQLKETFAEYARLNNFTATDIENDLTPMLGDPAGWLDYLRHETERQTKKGQR